MPVSPSNEEVWEKTLQPTPEKPLPRKLMDSLSLMRNGPLNHYETEIVLTIKLNN